MTLIYSVGKNFAQFGSPEYLGFAHYRRYLAFNENNLAKDIILCSKADCGINQRNLYNIYHVASDLNMFMDHFN